MSKKVLYQKNTLSRSQKRYLIKNLQKMLYKKTHQESKKGALSRNLIKNLKVTNKASLRVYKKIIAVIQRCCTKI